MTQQRTKIVGIKRRGPSWFVTVRVKGHLHADTFPLDTPMSTMVRWREEQVARFGNVQTVAGSFGADIDTYLARVAAMPTIHQRAAHLALWAQALGRDRPRLSITTAEIDAVMQDWMTTPTNQPDPAIRGRRGRPSAPGGVSKATVKKRRAALRAFFNTMNGGKTDGYNPVRGSQCPRVSDELEARGLPMADAARIVAAMPEWADVKKGAVPRRAHGRLFADVMLWTGLPPILLNALRASDLALDAEVPWMRVRGRDKGHGVEARTIPICPQAVAAFRRLAAANVWGQLPANLNQAVKRAARRAHVDVPADFHLYDLRHSFGSALYGETKDIAAVGRALMHAKHSTVARRYTEAAHRAVDAAGVAALGVRFGGMALAPTKLAAKVSRGAKSNNKRHLRKVS
jgi:integrase